MTQQQPDDPRRAHLLSILDQARRLSSKIPGGVDTANPVALDQLAVQAAAVCEAFEVLGERCKAFAAALVEEYDDQGD